MAGRVSEVGDYRIRQTDEFKFVIERFGYHSQNPFAAAWHQNLCINGRILSKYFQLTEPLDNDFKSLDDAKSQLQIWLDAIAAYNKRQEEAHKFQNVFYPPNFEAEKLN